MRTPPAAPAARPRRRPLIQSIGAAVPLAAGLLLLTGCGQASAPGGSRAGVTAASRDCGRAALQVSLDTSAAGVAAGSSYVPIEFRNTSAAACTLPAYPAVTFASGLTGPVIGLPATLERQGTVRALVLRPGHIAHAWLQIQDVASYPASSCQPETARGLRVGLGSTEAVGFISHSLQACAKGEHAGVLTVYPVQAGKARRGTAP